MMPIILILKFVMDFLKKLKLLNFKKETIKHGKDSIQLYDPQTFPHQEFFWNGKPCYRNNERQLSLWKYNNPFYLQNVPDAIYINQFFNGRFLMIVSKQFNTYSVRIYKSLSYINNTNTVQGLPVLNFEIPASLIVKILTTNNGNSFAVIGVYMNKKLCLFHYALELVESELLYRQVETLILPGYQYSSNFSSVTACSSYGTNIAFVLTDVSRYPQPLLLYVYDCYPKFNLKRFIDLSSEIYELRGYVTGVWISEINDANISLTTTCFQYIQINISKYWQYQYQELKSIFLEDDEETLMLFSCRFKKEYIQFALSSAGMLYNMSNKKSINIFNSIEDSSGFLISSFCYNEYRQSLFIVFKEKGEIYEYSFVNKIFTSVFCMKNCSLASDQVSTPIYVNWYGKEVYAVSEKGIYFFVLQEDDLSLKNLARLCVLKHFSKQELMTLNLNTKIRDYLQL